MNTEPKSPQRNHSPYQIQCPRCGTYNPKQNISYRNPRTGEHKSPVGLDGCLLGCLFSIVAYFVVAALADLLIIFPLLYVTGQLSVPGSGDAGMFAIPFAIVGAPVGFALYLMWRTNRLDKTNVKIWHFTCQNCKEKWDYVLEPQAKVLS